MFPPIWDPAGQLKEAFNFLFDLLMDFLSISLDLGVLGVVQWLFGNAAGLAPYLSLVVFLLILPGAVLARRLRLSGVIAFVFVMLSSAIVAMWFVALDALNRVGDGLTRMVGSIDTIPDQPDSVINIPPIPFSNPILDILVFASLFWGVYNFFLLFMGYELYLVFLGVFGLLLLAIYGLGPRVRRTFSIIVAIGLSAIFGRPLIIFVMKLGNMLANAFPVNSASWVGLVTAAAMGLGVILAIALPFGFYHMVDAISGSVLATVRNTVSSRIENKHKVDASVSGKISGSSTNRFKSVLDNRYKHSMASEARRMAGTSAATALTGIVGKGVALGSNIHPVAKTAVVAASIVAKGVANAPPKMVGGEKVNKLDKYR